MPTRTLQSNRREERASKEAPRRLNSSMKAGWREGRNESRRTPSGPFALI